MTKTSELTQTCRWPAGATRPGKTKLQKLTPSWCRNVSSQLQSFDDDLCLVMALI